MAKHTVNEKCAATEVCNDVAGLGCHEGVCKCEAAFFWKEKKCGNLTSSIFYYLLSICC